MVMRRFWTWIFLAVVSPLVGNGIYYLNAGEFFYPTWVSCVSAIASYFVLPFFALESKWIAEESCRCR